MTEKEFEILYLCLGYENIVAEMPKKMKEESLNPEDIIIKRLYKDYSEFKIALYLNLNALNPQFDSLVLFKKSQSYQTDLYFLQKIEIYCSKIQFVGLLNFGKPAKIGMNINHYTNNIKNSLSFE